MYDLDKTPLEGRLMCMKDNASDPNSYVSLDKMPLQG